MFRAHIRGRAHKRASAGQHGVSGICGCGCLCQAEVDDAWHRLAIHFRNQDVGWFQIAVHDGFLMRMLHPFAYLHKEREALSDAEPPFVAVLSDRDTRDVLHYKIWLAIGSGASVEHLGDSRMFHHG